jgi:hypothetical protein
MSEEIKEFAPVTPKYDKTKRYTWSPDEEFKLTGSEFAVVINSLRATLNTEAAANILLADKASNIIEDVLARAVEDGKVVEAPPKNS